MRENYGLYSWWDVNNNCFVAFSPDYALCRGTLDRQRDELVYELYGLTGEEVALVEGANGHSMAAGNFDARLS